jgi:TRAP-type C4-dicarboxylate transport system permease large subunit
MNLFVINSMAKGISLGQTYKGVLPFVATDLVRTAILTAFPIISLFLVRLLY